MKYIFSKRSQESLILDGIGLVSNYFLFLTISATLLLAVVSGGALKFDISTEGQTRDLDERFNGKITVF